jgi:hypothetical protein
MLGYNNRCPANPENMSAERFPLRKIMYPNEKTASAMTWKSFFYDIKFRVAILIIAYASLRNVELL